MNLNINDIQGGKADDKLQDTSAAAKGKLLRGYEGVWIKLRRNNYFYVLNKLISMGIAIGFAVMTLIFKLKAMNFIKAQDDPGATANKYAAAHMQNIYWLMFIYLCMQGMDELIELFSQINQMEKGALGLFFEMNHFVGIGLSIYVGWFVAVMAKPKFATKGMGEQHSRDYKLMYNWIYFQYIWTIFCFLFSIMVYCMYKGINNRVVRKQEES